MGPLLLKIALISQATTGGLSGRRRAAPERHSAPAALATAVVAGMTQDPAQNGAGKIADQRRPVASRAHRWCAANGK